MSLPTTARHARPSPAKGHTGKGKSKGTPKTKLNPGPGLVRHSSSSVSGGSGGKDLIALQEVARAKVTEVMVRAPVDGTLGTTC